jgi:probable phosphoglycerate mutase
VLKLCLLRHAETAFSRQDRFCGRLDAPLTQPGREMARWFAEIYAELGWRALYASTRARAVDTAAPLAARLLLPVHREPGLDEIDHGAWQGMSKSEVAAADPARYRRWCEDPTSGAPGGESVLAVRARALQVLDVIRRRHDDGGGHVLVVSHKTTLRVLISSLMGVELAHYRERIAQPTCGLTIIGLASEGPVLELLGDLGHLPPALRARALSLGPAETEPERDEGSGLQPVPARSTSVIGG